MVPACLPIPPSLHVDALLLGDDGLTILTTPAAETACCPLCGMDSTRIHSRSLRTLVDLPWATVSVQLRVRIRRFFCDNDACPRRIFAERLADVSAAHAQRTNRQRVGLTAIALALGGEAGSRLAAILGMPASPDTLLRLIRQVPETVAATPTMLGVDDWAIHKGLTYGTILVDLERHTPVDLLPDRSRQSLAAWLRAHSGVHLIAHDPAGVSAEGAHDGAPDAVHVADRWHLVDNLADALEEFFRAKGACLTAATAALIAQTTSNEQDDDPTPAPSDAVSQGKRRHPQPERWRDRQTAAAEAGVARRRETYEQARALHANGMTIAEIARTVGIGRRTVSRYLRRDPPARTRRADFGQRRVITPYEPSLLQRWAEGCHTPPRCCGARSKPKASRTRSPMFSASWPNCVGRDRP